jgi:hypothetical protein
MNANILKKVPIALAALATSSVVYAMDMDARVSQLEAQMRQCRTETAMETYGALTAGSRAVEEGHGFMFNFEVFYAHARPAGTEFCYTDDSNSPLLPINGSVKDIDFSWDWGFKVGLGYNLDHDNWDIMFEYTYFDTSGSRGVDPGTNSITVPLVGWCGIPEGAGGDEFFTFSDNAKAQASLDFDVVDVELGRNYFVSKKLAFRPFLSLESAWVKLSKEARFTGGAPSNSPEMGFELGDATIYVKDRSNFWGLGPRMGTDTQWHLGNGFSIFGDISAALLFGRFKVSHREQNTITNRELETIDLSANMHQFVPKVDLAFGLAYGDYVCNKEQYIEVSLGYECTYFWSVNQSLDVDQTNVVLQVNRDAQDIGTQAIVGKFSWQM